MTADNQKNPSVSEAIQPDVSTKKVPHSSRNSPHIISYMVILFLTAFLLLLVSYFMQQRQSDREVISGLQSSGISATQTIHNVLERNQQLLDDNEELRERLEAEQERGEAQERQLLAMDWLWRIQREYYRGHYSDARELIRTFEATDLADVLSAQPLVDETYLSPKEQFENIRNALF